MLDGRIHGPLSRADLEELLNRSGETACDARVRKGPELDSSLGRLNSLIQDNQLT